MAQIPHLMQLLAAELEVPGLEPDVDGHYHLDFADGLRMTVRAPNRKSIMLHSELGSPPSDPEDRKKFFENHLSVNLARMQKQRAALSIDPDTGALVLFQMLHADRLEGLEFIAAVELFLNTAELWRNRFLNQEPVQMPVFPVIMP